MPATDSREFDIIIFGASGMTGRYAIEELSQCITEFPELNWAIAGRNICKLKNTLESVQELLPQGIDIRSTPIVKADTQDPSSVEEMCKRTKLLLNLVGPYNIYGGEMVVSTSIKCRTHCIDISAEIKYLDSVQAKHFKAAREAGVYIVGACGIGSIPTDYSIALLMKKFPGGLNSVEYFVEFLDGPQGRPTGYGTFVSAVYSMTDYFKAFRFEEQVVLEVFKEKPAKSNFPMNKLIKKSVVMYSFKEKSLCLKYVGPDVRNIKRSQMFRANFLNKKMFIETIGYLKLKSVFEVLLYSFVAIFAAFMTLFAAGRSLMVKYPSFFTAEIFTKTGPTRQQILKSSTRITFYAKGWKNKMAGKMEPDKKIKMSITGQEPAYAFTAVCMIQACLTVLLEHQKIPLEWQHFLRRTLTCLFAVVQIERISNFTKMKRAFPIIPTIPAEKKVKFTPCAVPESDDKPLIIEETKKTFTLQSLPPHHYHLGDGNFIVVSDFAGVVRVHCRKYTVNENGEYIPSKKGMTVTPFIWQSLCKFLDCDSFGDVFSHPRRTEVLEDSLLLSYSVEEETNSAYITMQRYFVKRDMSRDFAPGVCVMTVPEWERLITLREDVTKSVFSVLFGKTFRAKVLREIKLQKPPSSNDNSMTPTIAEMVLTTSLVEILMSYIEDGIQKIFDCDGCNRNLANQLGHDCIYMSFESRMKRYGQRSISNIDLSALAHDFVKRNIEICNYISGDFIEKLDAEMLIDSASELYIANDPSVWKM